MSTNEHICMPRASALACRAAWAQHVAGTDRDVVALVDAVDVVIEEKLERAAAEGQRLSE
jgi:hypothetical protein